MSESRRSELELFNRLSIVVPAFNEERGIRETVRTLSSQFPGAEVIVVDDGSTDGTGQAALEFPTVIVAQHRFNRGYGAGLKTGMTIASREYVAWFDADNEHRAADLSEMLQRISHENLGAVIAQRRVAGPSPVRNVGKWAIRLLARALDIEGGKDINCGLRIFRRDVICRYLGLLPDSFSASTTSTAIMLERGYPIAYHDIELNPRIGESKVRIVHGFVALMLVLRIIMLFAPMRIFLRSGAILFAIGLIYGVAVAVAGGRGLPAAAIFLMLGGLLFVFFGLIADQISQMRLAQYDEPLYRVLSGPLKKASAHDPHEQVDERVASK